MDQERYTSVEDSLFDKTGKRTSVSSESVFGFDPSYAAYGRYVPSQQFRPLSIMSEMSVHSPVKEDDTMITVSPSAGAVVMMMLMLCVRRCLVADTFVGAP